VMDGVIFIRGYCSFEALLCLYIIGLLKKCQSILVGCTWLTILLLVCFL
jgi:hypothetical protein